MSFLKVREGEKEWILKAAAGVVVSILLYAVVVQPVFQDILTARQDLINSKKRLETYKEI
jgi:type II secretory pathway component PulM